MDLDNTLKTLQHAYIESEFIDNYQNHFIPTYDINNIDLQNKTIKKDIYNQFYEYSGAIIVKNAFSKPEMNEYNKWCEDTLVEAKKDDNFIHPKQKNKFLINNVIDRMSHSNPDLLVSILNNEALTFFMDSLLGFGKIGSCTTHWIEPGGERQLSHVDYPIHVGSAPFWENSVEKVAELITNYQLNHILPYYSIQILIASDKMNQSNGSTEIVPCSHKIENIDLLIQDKQFYDSMENKFINVELEQGDFLIFNRRLCHRGGKNISTLRRNSLILQCVWLFGIGQELIDSSKILNRLSQKSSLYRNLSNRQQNKFNLRIQFPYPLDVSKTT